MNFDYGEYVGQPLLFSSQLQRIANGKWAVQFTFGGAPEGRIEFECNDILSV